MPGKPMPVNKLDSAAPAVAPDHEGDEEGRRPDRSPEHHRPAVAGVDEAGDRAAETPDDRRQADQHEADALVARRNRRRARRRRLSLPRLTHVACGRQQAPCRRNSRGSQSARTIQSRSVWRGPAAQSGCGNRAAACRSPASPAAGEPWPDGAQQPPCGAISVICAAIELVVASRTLFAAREFLIDHRPNQHLFHHAISRLKFDN